jgi:hypothetical protein
MQSTICSVTASVPQNHSRLGTIANPLYRAKAAAVANAGAQTCRCTKDTVLTLDRQRRPRLARADGRRMTAADTRDDGASIFCAISLALMIVALWAAASGQADVSAAMF